MTTLEAPASGRGAGRPGPRLARLYTPLAIAALLAALAGPVLNHALSHAARPTQALAGFWVGYSVLLLLEAACFVWQPTSLAFLEGPRARRRLSLLALATGAVTSAAVWAVGAPANAAFVFRVLVPTGPEAARTAAEVLRALAPLPAMVALRGVLAASVLRDGRGAAIPMGLLMRLGLLALWPMLFPSPAGARAACEALLAATTAELIVLGLARNAARAGVSYPAPPATARVMAVAAPLVVSTLAWAALRPVLQAVLGRLAHADLAQARFGLVFAVFMTLCAPVWALRDFAVLAEGLHAPREDVRRFGVRVAGALSLGFCVVLLGAALLPGLRAMLGFTPATGPFAWGAFAMLALAPLLVAARMPAQGVLIARHRTGVFALVPGARLALTATAGLAAARALPGADGALLGAALLLSGEVFEAWAYGRAAAAEAEQWGVPHSPTAPGQSSDLLSRVA